MPVIEHPSSEIRSSNVFGGFKTPRAGSAVRTHHRPQTDILRSYAVGIVLVAALLTAEAQALPVRCRDESTLRASPRCVLWVDNLRFDTDRSGLVRNKELSLRVGPAVNLGTEFLPFTQRTVSCVRQVFQADRPCIVLDSVGHQLLGCSMEHRYRYGCLMPAHAPQETPRAFGTNGLDGRAFAADTGTAVVFHTSLEKECSAVRRVGSDHESLDSEVATDNGAFGFEIRNFDLVRETQIPHLTNAFNLGVLPPGFRDRGMLQRDGLSQNGYAFLVLQEIAPVGQGNRRTFVNTQRPAPQRLLCFVAGRHLSEQGARKLGREPELLTDNGVEGAGKAIGVQLLRREHLLGDPAGRSKVVGRDSVYVVGPSNLNLDCADCFQYKTT